ncbi:hypothetical protein LCGC14_2853940 [marine sediment metagenome]|uniref:Uncharacterized protein n=1 Tax=marine sediment metagenome TaxID=412755 RepID=A0A0F9AYK2_9ZZZZ
MALKSFKHQGKEVWDNWTRGKKEEGHRRGGIEIVKIMKKLSHRYERVIGKKIIQKFIREEGTCRGES